MKRLMVLLSALLCLSLCACNTKSLTIIGTWEGSGTVSIIGENTLDPAEFAEYWTFPEDGTATVEIVLPETALPAIAYTYTLKKDILTLISNDRSEEFSGALDEETMTLDGTIVFTRVE